jgi:hypothetical protein
MRFQPPGSEMAGAARYENAHEAHVAACVRLSKASSII